MIAILYSSVGRYLVGRGSNMYGYAKGGRPSKHTKSG